MSSRSVGELVWADALVQWPDYSVEGVPGSIDTMVLVYSYFDGVYVKADGRGSEGRPVYVEQNKYDHAPYDEMGFGTVRDPIVPAEFKYCGGRWIFTHKFIRKSASEEASVSRILHYYFLPTIFLLCLMSS